MLVEIFFVASAFQCGGSAPQAQFQLHTNNGIVLNAGERAYVSVESIEDLQFGYSVVSNGSCVIPNVPGISVSYGASLPTNEPAYQQPSLLDLVATHVTDAYLSLVLFEVGTLDSGSSFYDLQDLVVQVDTNQARVIGNMSENVYAD